jgi:hypothetical protein
VRNSEIFDSEVQNQENQEDIPRKSRKSPIPRYKNPRIREEYLGNQEIFDSEVQKPENQGRYTSEIKKSSIPRYKNENQVSHATEFEFSFKIVV